LTVSDVALVRSKLLESYSRSSRPSKKIASGEDEFDVEGGAECLSVDAMLATVSWKVF